MSGNGLACFIFRFLNSNAPPPNTLGYALRTSGARSKGSYTNPSIRAYLHANGKPPLHSLPGSLSAVGYTVLTKAKSSPHPRMRQRKARPTKLTAKADAATRAFNFCRRTIPPYG